MSPVSAENNVTYHGSSYSKSMSQGNATIQRSEGTDLENLRLCELSTSAVVFPSPYLKPKPQGMCIVFFGRDPLFEAVLLTDTY